MTTFTLSIEGESLKKATPDVVPQLQRILTKYTLQMQRDIVMNTPADTGFLRGSIQPIIRGLVGEVSSIDETKKYALFVEYDTKPHWPPIKALKGWADRHKISPYLVALGISRHGTKGHHMFERGVENVDTDAMMEEISAALGEAWAD